jgi:hypothetical protein
MALFKEKLGVDAPFTRKSLTTLICSDLQNDQLRQNENLEDLLNRRLDRLMHTVARIAEALPLEAQAKVAAAFGYEPAEERALIAITPKLVIQISGGNLQAMNSNVPLAIDIVVLDSDNMKADGMNDGQIDSIHKKELLDCAFVVGYTDHAGASE